MGMIRNTILGKVEDGVDSGLDTYEGIKLSILKLEERYGSIEQLPLVPLDLLELMNDVHELGRMVKVREEPTFYRLGAS